MSDILQVFEYNQHFVAMMNVINAARLNPPKEGHRHHIIPKCWYKINNLSIDNSKDNLVLLSYEDHIKVHKLAYLCVKDDIMKGKLAYAYHRLTQGEIISNNAFKGERNANYGKHHKHSDETKKRISDGFNRYLELHPEYRDECRIRSTGRTFSEESKLKKSKSLKGRIFTDEWKAKLSAAAKNRRKKNA